MKQSTAIRQGIRGYLDHIAIERGLSKNTLSAYSRDLDRYAIFCEQLGITEPKSITSATIRDFSAGLAKGSPDKEQAPLARSSVSRMVSAVRGMHKFWLAEGLVDVDVAADVNPGVPTRGLPKALTVVEIVAILGAPSPDEIVGIRDRALLEFLYGTGARVSEATNVGLNDIDLESRQVVLRGKGDKQRIVPLGSHAITALDAYLVRARPALARDARIQTPNLFLNQRGASLSRQSVWLILRAASQKAGVVAGTVSPHVMRHSFATHLMDGGADVRVVQELLGHASVSTTQIYTLVTVDKLREVYMGSHPRALA